LWSSVFSATVNFQLSQLYGCIDSLALNYNPTATISNDSCCYVATGCTDPLASNYDSLACADDSSCIYNSIYGCTDSIATNYNPNATIDDGSCAYCNITVFIVTTQPSCYGGADGTATANPTGGTPPYTYQWGAMAQFQTTATATGLSVNITYNVTVTDNNGCSDTVSVTISQPAPLTVSSTATQVSCNGGFDGSIDITVTGGTQPYTYLWNPAGKPEISSVVYPPGFQR
jgi:hypothetical protein